MLVDTWYRWINQRRAWSSLTGGLRASGWVSRVGDGSADCDAGVARRLLILLVPHVGKGVPIAVWEDQRSMYTYHFITRDIATEVIITTTPSLAKRRCNQSCRGGLSL